MMPSKVGPRYWLVVAFRTVPIQFGPYDTPEFAGQRLATLRLEGYDSAWINVEDYQNDRLKKLADVEIEGQIVAVARGFLLSLPQP